jgi:hypothetical protein
MPKNKVSRPVRPFKLRIGAMEPDTFRDIGEEALGGRGWQRALGHATGWSPSTITRYLQGSMPIPKHAALLMDLILATKRAGTLPVEPFLYENFQRRSYTRRKPAEA